ncbi:diguanylate phosphodiesterase [Amylibacter marinus]|uniref:Diguanylate phosphodiesterase n=1 Tax=Amylibacter marinus TaxID=1475483 RepID=A0ABQ5VXC9_9RHOB|nr:EAL domain-containing protein [Amylibacter marinus]GLQ35852.1 diguanylate phosphodiesterase [Amylibacter marinus]
MRTPDLFEIPTAPADPLEYAASKDNEPILETVRRAIKNKHVMLAYQPVVHAKHPEKPAFYEGLVRVLDGMQQVVAAKDFMPVVETMELGRILDCHALELGLRALAEEPTLRLSINMSARSIGYPKWIQTLHQGMEADKTVAERLILEVTESSAMAVPELVTSFMADLHRYGISFALDDFGAGYTAFRFFKDFQFDIVKIDGQFIRNIDQDPDNQVLTEALILISKQFDMFTVAEHVETEEELKYLQKLGVDCLQGYHIGMPEIIPEWTESMYRKAVNA